MRYPEFHGIGTAEWEQGTQHQNTIEEKAQALMVICGADSVRGAKDAAFLLDVLGLEPITIVKSYYSPSRLLTQVGKSMMEAVIRAINNIPPR